MVSSSISINQNKSEVFINHQKLTNTTIVCSEGDSIEVLNDKQCLNLCQNDKSDLKEIKNGNEVDKDDGNIKEEHEISKENLVDIMNTLCTLTSKVEKLEKKEKKATSKKSDRNRAFLSFGKKKKKLMNVDKNEEEKKLKPVEDKKSLLFIPEEPVQDLEISTINPTKDEYQFPYAPSTDDPYSVISTSDKYRVQNNSLTDATDLTMGIEGILSPLTHPSTHSKSEVLLEKVDSMDDSVLQSWVSNVVCAAADVLEKNSNSPSIQKNAKLIARCMILDELENNENALFTKSQYEEISASTANLIVTALLSNINKEKVTLLAISHAIWGVLASKDCYKATCKNEVIKSLGSLFPDAGIINDGESLILPELSCSTFDGSSLIDSNNTNSVKYSSWTDFFDACLGKVDLLVDGSTIITDEIDTLEGMDTLEDMDTMSSIMCDSTSLVSYEPYSSFENREISEQEYREQTLEVREDLLSENKHDVKKRSSKKILTLEDLSSENRHDVKKSASKKILTLEDLSSENRHDVKKRSSKKILTFKKFRPFSKRMNVIEI